MAGTEDDPATESPQEGLEEQDLKAMFMSMMKEFKELKQTVAVLTDNPRSKKNKVILIRMNI